MHKTALGAPARSGPAPQRLTMPPKSSFGPADYLALTAYLKDDDALARVLGLPPIPVLSDD